MKYFFSRVFIVVSLFASSVNIAEGKMTSSTYLEKGTVAEEYTSENPDSTNDKSSPKSKKKDSQNQTEFLTPDMDSKEYNFYDRKKVSTPLMPRYDLDSAVYQRGTKKKEDQQKSFIENKYRYPARPRDQWEIGLQGGSSLISGDIRADWTKGWGGGFTVRKALNYYLSLRFSYIFSLIKSQDLKPRQDVANDAALSQQGAGHADYLHDYDPITGALIGTNEKIIFHNYKNTSHAVHLDAIVNLGNIMFHRERTLVNINVFFGVGFHIYRTQMDALDKSGKEYNFQPIVDSFNSYSDHHLSESTINKNIRGALGGIMSGNYAVDAVDPIKGHATLGKYYLVPDFSVGAGLDFHVSKWVTLGLEERFIYNGNSNLDGVNWQDDSHNGLAVHYDHYFSTMVQLKFQIGKHRIEPLWWLNPMDFTYKKISDVNPDKLAKELFKDTDEDGVPDRLDKEPNTKKNCPVDVKGVILDSDKDGIPDCDDKEPFSPPGYPIDANGVAVIPPNPCCDNTAGDNSDYIIDPSTGKPYENAKGEKIKVGTPDQEWAKDPATGQDFLDKEGNKVKNPAFGNPNYGKKKIARGGGQYDCSKMEMPGVFFDEDKYYLDPEYYSALHQVAEKLQMCPDVKMVITGVDESKNDQKYNEQLAYNRATSVADYLVEKYGISRDRFIVKYQGGKKSNANQTPQEKKKSRRVDFNYASDGDKGESNPPAPHPGLKAGSNK